MSIKTIEEMWDYLVDSGIATEDELQLVTSINGYSEETMTDVLYSRTAYRCFSQLTDEDEEEDEESD